MLIGSQGSDKARALLEMSVCLEGDESRGILVVGTRLRATAATQCSLRVSLAVARAQTIGGTVRAHFLANGWKEEPDLECGIDGRPA